MLCSAERKHLCNFGRGHHGVQFCKRYFEFGLAVQEQMSIKDISYLELWQPFRSAEQNHLCICGRRHHEEHFGEIILNLNQEEVLYERFPIVSSGCSHVQRSGTIYAILLELWGTFV